MKKALRMRRTLSDNCGAELLAWLEKNGEARFRAEQIRDWLFSKWSDSAVRMKNLPEALRKRLEKDFAVSSVSAKKLRESEDGTKKVLVELRDSSEVEAVVIPARRRVTFCLSSQVGCPVGCLFCASGKSGLSRNMTAGEILDELLLCCRIAQGRPDNIVFMGVGEPLLNLDALISVLGIIVHPDCFRFSPRRITVSSSGYVSGIKELADRGPGCNLAISIHAPGDKLRARLIPSEYRYPLAEIEKSAIYYRKKTGRKVTFEYVLIDALNDSSEDALQLAERAVRCNAKVNLIPLNPIEEVDFRPVSPERMRSFEEILKRAGVQVSSRRSRGGSSNAACGQLRAGAS